jgi:hypothetical protein
LYGLFDDMTEFHETTMTLYGKKTKVKYRCVDLIWKPTWKSTKSLIRFVAVELNGNDRCVLMSSDLSLTPEDIISIYGLRFKIETSFDEQKNDMGAFSYHFWTSAMPKRKKWQKAQMPTDQHAKHKVDDANRAIDSFVCCATIATGILTIIGFAYHREIWILYPGWLRTCKSTVPSIAVIKETIAHIFPRLLKAKKHFYFSSIIKLLLRDNPFHLHIFF